MINKQEQIQDLILESYSEYYEQNIRPMVETSDHALQMIMDKNSFNDYTRAILSKVSNLVDSPTMEAVNCMLNEHRDNMLSMESDTGLFSGGVAPTSAAIAYFVSSFPLITSIYLESIISQVSTLWPVKSPMLSIPKIEYFGRYILPNTASGYGTKFDMSEQTTLRRDNGLTVTMSSADDSSIIALYNNLDVTLRKYVSTGSNDSKLLSETWNQEYDLNKVYVTGLNLLETKQDDGITNLVGTAYDSISATKKIYVPKKQRFKVNVLVKQDSRNSIKLTDWKYNRLLIANQTFATVGTATPETGAKPYRKQDGNQHTYLSAGLIIEDKYNLGSYYYSDDIEFDRHSEPVYQTNVGIVFSGDGTTHNTSKAKYLVDDALGKRIPLTDIWQKDIYVYTVPSAWTYSVELIGHLNLDAGTFSATPKVKKIVGLSSPTLINDCPVKSFDLKIKFSGKTSFNGSIEVFETTSVREIDVPVSDSFLISTNVENVQNFRDLLKVDLLQGRLDAIKKRMAMNMDNELAQLLLDEEPNLYDIGHALDIDMLLYTTAGTLPGNGLYGTEISTLFTPTSPINVFKGLLLQISSLNDKVFDSKRMFPQFLLAGRNTASMLRNMQGEARTGFSDYSHGKLGFPNASAMSTFQSQIILRSPSIADDKIYAIYKPEQGSEKYATILNVVYQPMYQQAFNYQSTNKTLIRSRRTLELIDPKGIGMIKIKNLETFFAFR